MNIEIALKSRSYILDLDHVKLSLGIFFLLGCLVEWSLLHQLSGYTFIFVKNTHQKSANLTFLLILPAAMVPWWFLGVQYKLSPEIYLCCNNQTILWQYIYWIVLNVKYTPYSSKIHFIYFVFKRRAKMAPQYSSLNEKLSSESMIGS